MWRWYLWLFPHHRLRLPHKSLHCALRSKQDASATALLSYVCVLCIGISHVCVWVYIYGETEKFNEYPLVTKSYTHTHACTHTHTVLYCPFYTDQQPNKAVLLQTKKNKKYIMKWIRMSCNVCIMSCISMSRAGWVIFTCRWTHAI